MKYTEMAIIVTGSGVYNKVAKFCKDNNIIRNPARGINKEEEYYYMFKEFIDPEKQGRLATCDACQFSPSFFKELGIQTVTFETFKKNYEEMLNGKENS